MKILLIFVLALITGCCSSPVAFQKVVPVQNPGMMLVTTSRKAELKMKSWTALVASGKVDQKQDSEVRMAYYHYQFSMDSATNAYVSLLLANRVKGWMQATQAVSASSETLLKLITEFGSTVTNR